MRVSVRVLELSFRRHTVRDWKSRVKPDWFTPSVDVRLYRRVKPIREEAVWSGSLGEIFAARTPAGIPVAKYHYSVAYELTLRLLGRLGSLSMVLVKPNNTGFIGAFLGDSRLREIMRRNGISLNPDLQPIATQPAMLAGVVDAMLDQGVDEIHIGENMLWAGGTPRAFWETGYFHVFKEERYRNRVYFVDIYEDRLDVEELPIKAADGYDLGFFTKTRPPKALLSGDYDLVLIASIAKTHNCAYYSLLVKNFSVTWNPKDVRWRIHGIPVKLFDREHASLLLDEDFPRDLEFKVYLCKVDGRTRVFISNGYASTPPLSTYRVGGELMAHVDPHHLKGLNLSTLTLGMGYLVTRFTGMYATVMEKLKSKGVALAGIVSGMVGQEGEGPLIYGSRKMAGFALAGFDIPAMEALTLEIMMGSGDEYFKHAVIRQNAKLAWVYGLDYDKLMAEKPWTLSLLEKLTGESIKPGEFTLTLLDFGGDYDVKKPWNLRLGSPFKPAKAFYVKPSTWLKLLYTDRVLFKHCMECVDKNIEVPIIPPM